MKMTTNKGMMFSGYCSTLILSLLLLSACQQQEVKQDLVEDMEKSISEAIETNSEQTVPDAISDSLIPTITLDMGEVPIVKDDERFDIAVNGVPADQFFLSLVDGTDYNMVIHPEVSGNITLNLRNVTIPEVMEAARDVFGFEFVNTEYGFQVLPARLRARIYQINYLNIERSGNSSTSVSSGSLTQNNNNNDPNAPVNRSANTAGASINTQQTLDTFWTELRDSVSAIIGSGEGRSVVVNPQSGVVVARALPNELREVESYLQATQLIVQRQVILEAKILEVRLSNEYQAGINWSGVLSPGSDSITASNIGGGSVLVDEGGRSIIAGNTGNLDPSNPSAILGSAASAFGGVFTLALNLGDFNAFIELLETQGNVQVLSSPRVATLNNQKAIIKVGQDEFFVTDVSAVNSISAAATIVNPDVTLTPFFSGIALDVTPQISQNGDVTLHVHPSISDVVDQQKTVTVGNVTQQLPLALSTVRESDSIVRAKSGQVIVIGGLMQETRIDRDAQTPVLGDIPGVGALFKQRNDESVKTELVILLKPIVVDSTDDWNQELDRSRGGLKRIREQITKPADNQFLDTLFANPDN